MRYGFEYVKGYFQRNFPEYYLIFVDDVKDDVLKSQINKRQYEFVEAVQNKINRDYSLKNINRLINDYLNRYFTEQQRKDCRELNEYVQELLTKSVNSTDLSDDIFDHIVKKISAMILPQYDKSRLNTQQFDQTIINTYRKICKQLLVQVSNKVNRAINVNSDVLNFIQNKINREELQKFVVDSIFLKEKRNVLEEPDLISIKTEKYVNQYVAKNAQKRPNTVDYITNYIKELHPNVNTNLLNETVLYIDKMLREKEGLGTDEIVSLENKSLIEVYYWRYLMNLSSVKTTGQPEKIEKKGRKRQMSAQVIALLLVSTLLGASTLFAFEMDKYTTNRDARKEVAMFDSYSYPQIDSIYDNDLEKTMSNVLVTYLEYSKYNDDNYKYLGFYRAFASVESESHRKVVAATAVGFIEDTSEVTLDESLFVMDKMFASIKKTISNNDTYADLNKELMGDFCYLNFIYDRLYDMGFEKVRDEKYTKVLDKYIEKKIEHPLLNPLKYMNSRDKKIIEEVCEKYNKYSEQYIIEFGKMLGEEKKAETEGLSDDTGGRSI